MLEGFSAAPTIFARLILSHAEFIHKTSESSFLFIYFFIIYHLFKFTVKQFIYVKPYFFDLQCVGLLSVAYITEFANTEAPDHSDTSRVILRWGSEPFCLIWKLH